MPPKPAKTRKSDRIAGAKREAVLSAIAAGESDHAVSRKLRVDRETVGRLRASEDGQRVLAQVAEVGEATREEMLRVGSRVMLKGLRRLDETIEHIDPRDVPAALGPSLKMLFAQKVEHTGKNGEDLFQKYRQMPLAQLREEARKLLADAAAQDDNMPDE